MKFCPKCSLKIKGSLTHCPLCMVELLSCADDEDGEVTSKVTAEEKQDSLAADLKNIILTSDDIKDGLSTNKHRDSLQENTIDNIDRPDKDDDPKGRLKKLESNLNSLEKKLNLALSHNDIFKGTVADMGSWIKKLDISLAEIKKSLGSSDNTTQDIKKESSRLELQIDQCVGDLEGVKNNLKDLHDKIDKDDDPKGRLKKLDISLAEIKKSLGSSDNTTQDIKKESSRLELQIDQCVGDLEGVKNNLKDLHDKIDKDDAPKGRLKKLESNLNSLEKKLDISLAEIKKSLGSSNNTTQDIKKESSRLELQIDQCAGDQEGVRNNLKDLHDKMNTLSEECRIFLKIPEDNKSKISSLELNSKVLSSSLEELQAQSRSNQNSLEKKLNLALSHNDIIKGTVADMESWIKKLDISLAEIKKSLGSSNNTTQDIKKEISRLEPQIDQCAGDQEGVRNNLKDLHDKMHTLSEVCRISLKISEYNKSKISSLELHSKIIDFEPSISPLNDENISQPKRVKTSNLPVIIISIIAATIISLWYGFYILNSPEQILQEENSSKIGKIVSVLKSVTSVELPNKTKIEEKDFKKPKKSTVTSSHSKKSTSVPKAKTKKDSSPPKKSITASAPSKKSSGYTINVGSFQDKKLAQNLTKKLLKKGYPALMFPSKKNKWYSVKIGAFSSLKDAGKYAATLNEKEKLPTFITNIYPKTKKEEKDFKKPKKSTVTSSHSKKSTSVPKAKTKKDSSPPKKSITASAPSKKSSGYTINVGSFQDKKLAQNLTKKLLKKGYPALMFPSKKNKWYRVKVGAFSSLKDAGKYAATLNEKEKLPAFITNIY